MARGFRIGTVIMWIRALIVLGCLATAAILYGVWVVFSAWFTVRALPREEVFLCYKHGPIHKKNVIHFNPGDGGNYVDYCPICFSEKMSAAEKIPG